MPPPSIPAGIFDVNQEYLLKVTVRKGDIRNRPRAGVVINSTIRVCDGIEVLKAKAFNVMRRSPDLTNTTLISEEIFFKKAKCSAQSQFVPLTDENYEDLTRAQWNLISQKDVDDWLAEGKTPIQSFFFEIFLYVHRERDNALNGLRRATTSRMQESAARIQQFAESNNINLGEITRQHLTTHFARQQEGTDITLPNDNTTRQAQFLDQQREAIRLEESKETEERANNCRSIRIFQNNVWQELVVDIVSLRRALGLPEHDIFLRGIFNEYQHRDISNDNNMDDVDHQI